MLHGCDNQARATETATVSGIPPNSNVFMGTEFLSILPNPKGKKSVGKVLDVFLPSKTFEPAK